MGLELTIQFVRNYTAEPIGNALREAAEKLGLSVKTHFGAYDNLGAEIANIHSSKEPPSIVVVTIDLNYFSGGIFSTKWDIARAIDDYRALLATIDALDAKSIVILS